MKPNEHKKTDNGRKEREYPENYVGFPERNDASDPNKDRERIHVDLETLDISRKNATELKKELGKETPTAKE